VTEPAQPPQPGRPPRRLLQLGIALALVVALVVLLVSLLSKGGPREYVMDNYEVESKDGSSAVLVSKDSVSQTASDIRKAWKPAQEVTDPAGIFLRYSDLVVAVTPRVEGGSTVYVDDEKRGYAHWFPFVGGFWGVGGGGPIGGTRGGGPGAGK